MRRLILGGLVLACLLAPGFAHDERRRTAGGTPAPPTGDALQPVITTSELVVGRNRFAFGLLQGDRLLEEAEVVVRIYSLEQQPPRLHAEWPAPYYRLEVIESGGRVHLHPDGTRHVHHEDTDVRGLYVTYLSFERPGTWGLEVLAKGDGPVAAARFTVDVRAVPQTPALGAPAPRSRNLILGDVDDLRQIDTSDPPDPRLHRVRIADAIAQGKPQVIVFATPRYCVSRLCGPVLDVVRTLLPTYGDRVAFIHQEIWQDLSAQQLFPTVAEWNLPSEPWIFVVDHQGLIRAKFEGLTTARELEAALQQLLEQRARDEPAGRAMGR
jgi:hypothetical protein